jgi:conjugal transfer/type IV secretion protein DotA/TraY
MLIVSLYRATARAFGSRWGFFALLLVVCLVPALSIAQTPPAPTSVQQVELGAFELGDKDMSKIMLDSIFGITKNNQEVPFLGAAMRVFNIFALTFGTFMFTFVSVVGTLNSAQDGEILGRKWSSMWLPIRFVVGTAMLVPLATGYSSAQHGVLYLANVGSGAASMVWAKAMDNFAGSMVQNAAYLPENRRLIEILMKEVLRGQICNAALSMRYGDGTISTSWPSIPNTGIDQKPVYGITAYEVTRSNTGDDIYSWELRFGNKVKDNNIGGDDEACGYVKTGAFSAWKNWLDDNTTYQRRDPSGMVLRGSSTYSGIAPDKDQEAMNAMKALYRAQATLITQEANNFIPLAIEIARVREASENASKIDLGHKEMLARGIKEATERYLAGMDGHQRAATGGIKSKLDSFIKDSANAGWIMAGSTFFQMAAIQSTANEAVRSVPAYSTGSLWSKKELDVSKIDLVTDLDALFNLVENGFQGDSTDLVNPGDATAKKMGRWFAYDPTNTDHALVQLKNAGDAMMVGAQTLAITVYGLDKAGEKVSESKVASAVMEVVGKFPILAVLKTLLKEFMKAIVPVAYIIAGAMLVAGVTMSIILPTLPFVMTIGSITGWLMALFSAVVAAPIWLAGHLHPDGDGFSGQRAAGGYMILLETVTRPIFIIFGLMGAFLIMDPVMKFTSYAFAAVLNSVQADSTTGLISIVVFIVVYVTLIFTIVRTLLSLTSKLGEKVYVWIGGQFAGYDQAESFVGTHERASNRAAGQAFEGGQKVMESLLHKDRPNEKGDSGSGVSSGPQPTDARDPGRRKR